MWELNDGKILQSVLFSYHVQVCSLSGVERGTDLDLVFHRLNFANFFNSHQLRLNSGSQRAVLWRSDTNFERSCKLFDWRVKSIWVGSPHSDCFYSHQHEEMWILNDRSLVSHFRTRICDFLQVVANYVRHRPMCWGLAAWKQKKNDGRNKLLAPKDHVRRNCSIMPGVEVLRLELHWIEPAR